MHRRRRKLLGFLAKGLGFCLLIMGIVLGIDRVYEYRDMLHMVQKFTLKEAELRRLDIAPEVLTFYLEEQKQGSCDPAEEVTIQMMSHDYKVSSLDQVKDTKITRQCRKLLRKKKEYQTLYEFYKSLITGLMYFPVPEDLNGKQTVGFDDTWWGKRYFDGDRFHEGCDLMTSNNVRGYFPVVSITDGVVENKGWLKLGGYRIGIRSKSGCYYYYAHLFSYAEGLDVGDVVSAGELLGFMGDTGYSEIEGTTGNFDVHLHMGMYVMLNGTDTSVNPYQILRYLEHHKLAYYF